MADRPYLAVLGPPAIVAGTTTIAIRGRRKQALAEVLAIRHQRPVPVDVLREAIWGEEPPDTAASALRVHVSDLRRLFTDAGFADPIDYADAAYTLDLGEGGTDIARLEAAVAAVDSAASERLPAAHLDGVLGLWRDEPFIELDHTDLAIGERSRLDQLRWMLVRAVAEAALADRLGDQQVPRLEALHAELPYREDVASLLVRALSQSGRRSEALEVFDRTVRTLETDFGVEPSSELLEARRMAVGEPPAVGAQGASAPVDTAAGRVLGRERELSRCAALVETARLVTLVGAPGVGKTTIATEIRDGRDNVDFVDLEAVTTDADVAAGVARALAIRDVPMIDSPIELISRHLRSGGDGARLLILDNVEHVKLGVGELVDTCLAEVPGLRIIVTTRSPIGSEQERLVRVDPLPLCDPRSDIATLRSNPAVRLILRRCAELDGPAIGDADIPLIAEIAARLDGVPLALELAASVLARHGIRATADSVVDAVFGGVDAAGRRLPIARSVRWSLDLLEPRERSTLEAAATFVGAHTPDDLAAMVDGDGHEALAVLAARSLVTAGSGPRGITYRILAPVRDVVRRDTPEARRAELARLHADAMLVAARQLGRRTGRTAWDAFHEVRDDIEVALDWLEANGPAETHLQLIGHIWLRWHAQGWYRHGRRRAEAALARPEAGATVERADVLAASALLAWMQGDYDVVRRRLDEVRSIGSISHDLPVVEICEASLAWIDHDLEAAGAWCERGLDALDGDRSAGAAQLRWMSANIAWFAGSVERAAELYREAAAEASQRAHRSETARMQAHEALCLALGDHPHARAAADRVHAALVAQDRRIAKTDTVAAAGAALVHLGDTDRGRPLVLDGYRRAARSLNAPALLTGTVALAVIARADDRPSVAASVVGWFEAAAKLMPLPAPKIESSLMVSIGDWARRRLGDDAYADHCRRGATLPPIDLLEEIVEGVR